MKVYAKALRRILVSSINAYGKLLLKKNRGFPGGSLVKDLPANEGDTQETGFIPGSGRLPWSSEWLPSPVFLPGEFCGWKSLAVFSPWGLKESDTTEELTLHFSHPWRTPSV